MSQAIIPPNMDLPMIKAAFTTRFPGSIDKKKTKVAGLFGISPEAVYVPEQRHTDMIHILDDDMSVVVADAVVTQRKGILIGVQVADCIPVLLYDESTPIIAAVHAGWRGTASQILKKTIVIMTESMGAEVSAISVAIGPGIRGCCYEVDADVAKAVSLATGDEYMMEKKGDKYMIDLADANRAQAVSCGVLPGNIWVSGECTHCNHDRFYSFRYAGRLAGRQGGFIMMW